MQWVKRALGVLIVGYLAACFYAWTMQENLLFKPSSKLLADPASKGLAFAVVELRTRDGVALHGWYIAPPDNASNPANILFFHGNGGNVSHRLQTLKTFHDLGHAVLIIDYRGFGRSTGRASEAGTYLDAEAAWEHLTQTRGIAPDNIVIYGRSLGGAVAAHLASSKAPRALVLESTFTSLADMAAYRYPWLPVNWLLRMRYDSRARVRNLLVPVLLAHSPDDRVVPYSMAVELSREAATLTDFVALRGSHDRAFRRAGAAYYQRIDEFIRSAR